MDISTLSKQLNMSVMQLRSKMRYAGFEVSPRANKIDNLLAKQVLQKFSEKPKEAVISTEKKEVLLPRVLTVKELSIILKLDVTVIIKKLIDNGVMATINEEVDYDTAAIVSHDLGFEVSEKQEQTSRLGIGHVVESIKNELEEKSEEFVIRSPIVAVMGHVDHGKTTLLDTIRKTKVVDTESGGITQHIGAYQVNRKGKLITFLDTPGHEAFSAMRARGANVTDMIVLTVAAEDGVKPQTVEVINRAKLTCTPLIVAINKIDKPNANPERVKKELADFGVMIEEWGGNVPVAKISALTGEGVDDLLDLILLQSEVLELKANPKGQLLGTVIESNLSKTMGSVATILIQNGTLNLSDIVAVGKAYGKVRTMIDAAGKRLKTAGPSTPVQITGLSDVPLAGDIIKIYSTLDEAKQVAMETIKSERAKRLNTTSSINLCSKELNLILRVDVLGSLEAINEALNKLKNEEIKINIIEEGAGEISENDVLRAEAAKAIVIGFRARVSVQAAKLAQSKKVVIRQYDVIYELIEELTKQVVDMMTPEIVRTDLGKAKILAVFRTEKDHPSRPGSESGLDMIVGGSVIEGELGKDSLIEIKRDGEVMGLGRIISLQQNRIEVDAVSKGLEFGVSIKSSVKIEEGDLLVAYSEVVKKKTL
jgi:translation initiation factor IF-2